MENNKQNMNRLVKTLQFGEITVEPNHIFYFANGMLGFDELKEFVLISDEDTIPFKWLISLENPDIGFPLLSPWHVDIGFEMIEDYSIEKEVIFVVITLGAEKEKMTANMKAPIILDVSVHTGKQIILHSDKYSPEYPILR